MDKIIVYIIFILLVSLSVAIAAIAFVLAKRWREAYLKLKKKYNDTKNENIKLQHDLYRLTFKVPNSEKKKGTSENGTK